MRITNRQIERTAKAMFNALWGTSPAVKWNWATGETISQYRALARWHLERMRDRRRKIQKAKDVKKGFEP